MSVEQQLTEMRQALHKPPTPSSTAVGQQKQAASAVDFTQAIMELPKILPLLKTLVDEKQKENFYAQNLTRLDVDMRQMVNKVNANIESITSLQHDVKTRIDNFTLLEAKYTRMIERVNNVLSQLEKYLEKQ